MDPGALGIVAIPVPETNKFTGAVGWLPMGVTLHPGDRFVVTVSGYVKTKKNPEFQCCFNEPIPEQYLGAFGPAGVPHIRFPTVRNLLVQVLLAQHQGFPAFGLPLKPDQPGSGGPRTLSTDTITATFGGTLHVSRSGLPGEVGCGSHPDTPGCRVPGGGFKVFYHAGMYQMSGSQLAWVTVIKPGTPDLKLTASKIKVRPGELVQFRAEPDQPAEMQIVQWLWQPLAEEGEAIRPPVAPPCDASSPTCNAPVNETGMMWVGGFVNGVLRVAGVEVVADGTQPDPLTLEIVQVQTQLSHGSFTSHAGENRIQLTAEVSDPSRAADVQWEVVDNPDDRVPSGAPSKPANGLQATLTITSPGQPSLRGTARWIALAHAEPGELDQKALSFRIRAFVEEPEGRVYSEPRTITQDPRDALRQEYIDFNQPDERYPTRQEVLPPLTDGDFFTVPELLGESDYATHEIPLGRLTRTLFDQLDAMRRIYGARIDVNAGYRNPLHNTVHLRLGRNPPVNASLTSNHMYGYAADLFTGRERERFYALSRAGARVGACMEPDAEYFPAALRGTPGYTSLVYNWDHVHVDWDPHLECPAHWVQWASTLLP
jgi:hypothetical protein